jgi:hypothetical protein
VAFFEEHGFVVVRNALAGERLARVQAAWAAAAPAVKTRWEEARKYGVSDPCGSSLQIAIRPKN